MALLLAWVLLAQAQLQGEALAAACLSCDGQLQPAASDWPAPLTEVLIEAWGLNHEVQRLRGHQGRVFAVAHSADRRGLGAPARMELCGSGMRTTTRRLWSRCGVA